ncbi:sigma-54-dependent transcriptional regulator family protein [Thermocatellispora tengchongensis]|uniref:hypothetical protein n=1 Tax=Thermocatellispora tengchongensis TaxID=1073253 RepID=UPI003637FBB1
MGDSRHLRTVPVDPVDELDDYAVRLRRWHESAVTGGEVEDGAPRRLISASWRRSLDAGIDPEIRSAPLAYEQSDMRDIRLAHPLNPLLPLLAQTLLPLADQTGHVMVVTDAQGRVLWREGDHATMRRADGIGLTDGFDWGENAVGTNGIGTALAARRSVHVFSSEHLVRVLHPWSCSASPIIDPDTSEVLGCVDISGTFERLHPPRSPWSTPPPAWPRATWRCGRASATTGSGPDTRATCAPRRASRTPW